MSVPICEHIKPGGQRCASPAMNGQPYCYYHTGARACLPKVRAMFHDKSPHLPDAPPMPEFPIPFLEDAASIQIGYMQALYGITSHRLDLREAKLVLSALRGATDNLKRMEACVTACAQGASVKDTKKKLAASIRRAGAKSSGARRANSKG